MVAVAYFVWPLALYERVAPREEASAWYRFHMHQAFWFGLISGALAVAALLWPLLASFVISNVTVTIWVYAIALLLDGGLLTWWFVLAARYSRRAAHGDLFDVPWVSRLTGSTSRNR